MKRALFFETSLGRFGVAECEGLITNVFLPGRAPMGAIHPGATPLLNEARAQVEEYLSGGRQGFSLPLSIDGSTFSKTIWSALIEVPYGETRTYGQIATSAGRPGAARAVGQACRANPIPIIVPCHRIIGAHGSLTGYAGGLDIKRRLLELENAHL